MRLKLKNVGVLKEAEIDLDKDLIVLCGPNNTGKTYLAYTIFGLHRLLPGSNPGSIQGTDINTEILYPSIHSLVEVRSLDVDIVDFFSKYEKKLQLSKLKDLLPHIFATDNKYFQTSEIILELNPQHIESDLLQTEAKATIKFSNYLVIQLTKAKDERTIRLSIIEEQVNSFNKDYLNDSLITRIIEDAIVEIISHSIFRSTFIIPAERSAINIFSRELSIKRNQLIDEILELKDHRKSENPFDLLNKRAKRYPLPIRESLRIAEDLSTLKKEQSEYAYFADAIEREILSGKITISRDGELQFSPEKSRAKNIGVHLTASVVKSLSNLVFYFRHLAKKNDFIIIDEPELNLHPDNQRKIAKLLVRFVNAGFKVLISTHSDYIIREINNLIMLKVESEDAEKLKKKYGYNNEDLLDYDRVGAYLFMDKKNKALEVSKTGFAVASIDEVINNLNQSSEEIYFTLHD